MENAAAPMEAVIARRGVTDAFTATRRVPVREGMYSRRHNVL